MDKPALLRRLFHLGCSYSGQILSYTKMLGHLQDAGNTTTLAHYLDLLAAAGMLTGLQKYAGAAVRQRGSVPKFQVLNAAAEGLCQVFYWRESNHEVDFVGQAGRAVTAIEVKSGRARSWSGETASRSTSF